MLMSELAVPPVSYRMVVVASGSGVDTVLPGPVSVQ
jgi:hypothetical protein